MERPTTKDKPILAYIEFLEEKLKHYESSPYAKTYSMIKGQIDSFNEQLTVHQKQKIKKIGQKKEIIGGEKVLVDYEYEVEIQPGKIDLFGDKDDVEFTRAFKYMTDCVDLLKTLDALRAKMTPEEIKDLDKNIPLAERLVKNSNGKT